MLEPRQLGVGSGMSQYGWRIGSAAAGALALVAGGAVRLGSRLSRLRRVRAAGDADGAGHGRARAAPRAAPSSAGCARRSQPIWRPFVEFFKRKGALLVLLFILLHKIGDTLANLTFRLLFDDLGFTQRRDRVLRRRRRLLGLSDRHLHRRHALCAARHEAIGADQPDPDGGLELQLRAAGRGGPQQHRAWRARSASRISPAASAA